MADLGGYVDPNQKKRQPGDPSGDLAAPMAAGTDLGSAGGANLGSAGTAPLAAPSGHDLMAQAAPLASGHTQTAPLPAAPVAPAPAAPAAPVAAPAAPLADARPAQVGGPSPVQQASPAGTTQPPPPPVDPAQSVYKDALMKQLSDAGSPASLNDPALKAQSDAYAVGQQRATEQGRSALAERLSQDGSTGVNSGNFNNELAGLYGRQGENQAGYNAGLVGTANTQKLAQMQSALQQMGGDINSEAGRQLQDKIASVQAQIQKDQLSQQNTQFGQSLAEQARQANQSSANQVLGINTQGNLGAGDLALRARQGDIQAALQLRAMNQQNTQFGQGLSSNNAQFSAGLNQQALMQLLGGL